MSHRDERPDRLQLLSGGRRDRWRLGPVLLQAAPIDEPPFPVAAQVVEEDCYRILSADPAVRPPSEHPVRLFTELARFVPEPPGRVLVGAGEPLELLTILYDLDREPPWHPDWLAAALAAVLQLCAERRITALALPTLGTQLGLPLAGVLAEQLRRALADPPPLLRRIWLQLPAGGDAERLAALGRVLGRPAPDDPDGAPPLRSGR